MHRVRRGLPFTAEMFNMVNILYRHMAAYMNKVLLGKYFIQKLLKSHFLTKNFPIMPIAYNEAMNSYFYEY